MHLTVTAQINAAVDPVFDVFTDLHHAAENLTAIKRIEFLTESSKVGKGTRFRETRIMLGKEATETVEITEFDRPSGFSLEGESCGARWKSEFRFQESGTGETDVKVTMTISPRTLLAKVLSPLSMLMMGQMRKCIEKDVAELTRLAEGAVQPPAAPAHAHG